MNARITTKFVAMDKTYFIKISLNQKAQQKVSTFRFNWVITNSYWAKFILFRYQLTIKY